MFFFVARNTQRTLRGSSIRVMSVVLVPITPGWVLFRFQLCVAIKAPITLTSRNCVSLVFPSIIFVHCFSSRHLSLELRRRHLDLGRFRNNQLSSSLSLRALCCSTLPISLENCRLNWCRSFSMPSLILECLDERLSNALTT